MLLDAKKLERARVVAGLLRRELAQRSGLSLMTIDKACTVGRVGIVAARQITTALGLRIADVILDHRSRANDGATEQEPVRASA